MRPAGPGAASAPAALPLCRSFLPLLARAIPTPGLVSSCCWPRARRPAPEEPRAGGARAEPAGRGHWASLGLFSAAGQAGGAGGRGKGPSGSQRGPSGLVLRSLSSCPNVSEGQRPNAAPDVCRGPGLGVCLEGELLPQAEPGAHTYPRGRKEALASPPVIHWEGGPPPPVSWPWFAHSQKGAASLWGPSPHPQQRSFWGCNGKRGSFKIRKTRYFPPLRNDSA